VIVSPFARRAFVAHTLFDHTSVLRFVEWRWDLDPLTERDATANNIAEVLDFKAKVKKQPAPPTFAVPPGPFGAACVSAASEDEMSWAALRDVARTFDWPV
jgi:phospholipase C